jgi:ATP-binding cassette subfamily B protein
MLKLKRFLKPFLGGLALAIVLLVVQAICELNLPNYMSNIVNVGIQQGGIESAAPEAISQDGYEFITMFMDEEEHKKIVNEYQLLDADRKNGSNPAYSETYPVASGGELYVFTGAPGGETSIEKREDLHEIFGTATWTMVNLLQKVQAAVEDGTLEQTLADAMAVKAEQADTPEELEELEALSKLDVSSLGTASDADGTSGADASVGTSAASGATTTTTTST